MKKRSGLKKLAGGVSVFVVAAVVVLIVVLAPRLRGISAEQIVNYTPSNRVLAAFLVIGAYAFKSMTVFFPVMVLYISVGIMFPPLTALLINLCGVTVMSALPYFAGRWLGRETVEGITERHPKAQKLAAFGSKNELFLSFFTRIINLLPGDLVSLFLGAAGIRCRPFLIGSILGLVPVMIPATLMGTALSDPFSPKFILSFALIALVSLGSMLLYRRSERAGGKQ